MTLVQRLGTLLSCHYRVLLFVMAWTLAGAVHAQTAMVTDLQGKATVSLRGLAPWDVSILSQIEAGSNLQLQAGATLVVLYLNRGIEYVFRGPAQIVFQPAGPDVGSGQAPVQRMPGIGPSIRIRQTGMGQGALVMRYLPAPTGIQMLVANGGKVLDTRPTLQWQAPQPGLKYQLKITDVRGRSLHEAQVDTTSYKVPVVVHLQDGGAYLWQVSTQLAEGRSMSGNGRFEVAPAELRSQVMALRPQASDAVSSRVLFALWLAQVELMDEARALWRALAQERPGDAGLRMIAAH